MEYWWGGRMSFEGVWSETTMGPRGFNKGRGR